MIEITQKYSTMIAQSSIQPMVELILPLNVVKNTIWKFQLLCPLINYYKHIFVRSKKVCLLWEKCLLGEKVLIMSVLIMRGHSIWLKLNFIMIEMIEITIVIIYRYIGWISISLLSRDYFLHVRMLIFLGSFENALPH